MISNNDTNLNLSFHAPNPCLLLLPRSVMLSPSPLSLSICSHLHSTATHRRTFLQILQEGLGKQGFWLRFEMKCYNLPKWHIALMTSDLQTAYHQIIMYWIKTRKMLKRTLFILRENKHAHFRGKPLFQATKQHLNHSWLTPKQPNDSTKSR